MDCRRLILTVVGAGLLLGAATLLSAAGGSKLVSPVSTLPPPELPDEIPTYTVPVKPPRAEPAWPTFLVPTKQTTSKPPDEPPVVPPPQSLETTPDKAVSAPASPDCAVCPPRDVCKACPSSPFGQLFDNLSIFVGPVGSKGPEDLGVNSTFGVREGLNWGIPLIEPLGIGLQVGVAYDYAQNAQRILRNVNGTTDRSTLFTTLGLFQRSPSGLVWGLGWDYRSDRYYAGLDMSQWRGQVGWQVTPSDEFGVWGSTGDWGDGATVGRARLHLRPINQLYGYWKHTWQNDAITRLWVGAAEGHDRFVLFNPPEPTVHHPIGFGGDLYVPLSDCLAIYGEANFITPNDTGTVTALLGFAFYPGPASTRKVAHSRFNPVLPLASPPNFSIDVTP